MVHHFDGVNLLFRFVLRTQNWTIHMRTHKQLDDGWAHLRRVFAVTRDKILHLGSEQGFCDACCSVSGCRPPRSHSCLRRYSPRAFRCSSVHLSLSLSPFLSCKTSPLYSFSCVPIRHPLFWVCKRGKIFVFPALSFPFSLENPKRFYF